MAFENIENRFSWFLRLIPFFLFGIGFVGLESSTDKAAPNATVFGCYAAAAGPPILLDGSGMHMKRLGFPAIPFHLERLKTGIVLTADAPIRADRTPAGYRFAINKRGIGWFMQFYRIENGQTYGVFEVNLLEGFQMLASDGKRLLLELWPPAMVARSGGKADLR